MCVSDVISNQRLQTSLTCVSDVISNQSCSIIFNFRANLVQYQVQMLQNRLFFGLHFQMATRQKTCLLVILDWFLSFSWFHQNMTEIRQSVILRASWMGPFMYNGIRPSRTASVTSKTCTWCPIYPWKLRNTLLHDNRQTAHYLFGACCHRP